MQILETIALIGVILATYIYVVKTILSNLSKSKGIISKLFWGILFFVTLSFLFSNDDSTYHTSSNYYDDSDNDLCDNNDPFDNDFLDCDGSDSFWDYSDTFDYDD